MPLSNIFTIANPDISSTNEALTFINFCSLGFKIILCSGSIGTDLFKNLKQQSMEFITPCNSNTFFIPKTKSMYKFQIYAHAHL